MKSTLLVLAILVVGCKGDSVTNPLAPPPPTRSEPTAAIAGYVYSQSGTCLVGAVIEVVDGTRAGLKTTQAGCDAPWDDANQGYHFELTANTNVRLRASAPGYQAREVIGIVDNHHQLDIVLAPE